MTTKIKSAKAAKAGKKIKTRLEYLRGELRAGNMSYSETFELQSLAKHIAPGDVELLEAAGVPEFPAERGGKSAGHTPGPWKTFQNYKGGIPLSVSTESAPHLTVCRVDWLEPRTSGKPSEIDIANARLIAAAPHLLAALENASAAWDKSDLGEEIDIGEIRAVIARAQKGN